MITVTFDFFINALIGCILLPDYDEFVQCIDTVLQYEITEDDILPNEGEVDK